MLAVASYNAGPGNVSKWLSTLGKKIQMNLWKRFRLVKLGYIRQVFGNYWNYLRLYNPEISQLVARYSTSTKT